MTNWSLALFLLCASTLHAADPKTGDPVNAAVKEAATDADRVQASLKVWEELRDKHQGHYTYRVSFSSFTGFGATTTVVVQDNKVVERRYDEFNKLVPVLVENAAPAAPKWVETGKEIGTHEEGAPAKTVDDFYKTASELMAQPVPESHRRYLEFDAQGVLKYCFLVDTRIADDAPQTGVPAFQLEMNVRK